MGIYRLDSKIISHDYPWVQPEAIKLYLIWFSSEYMATDLVADGYMETEAQYKAKSFKPASFYQDTE